MAKCVVCTSINAEAEHLKRSKALDRKNADGSVIKGYHHPTAWTMQSLRKRRSFFSPKTSPHKFCRVHSEIGTGRSTISEYLKISAELKRQDGIRKEVENETSN